MPFLQIFSSDELRARDIEKIKACGALLGYKPHQIPLWTSDPDCFSEQDVIMILVHAEPSDIRKPRFNEFCDAIAEYVRTATEKSVEVAKSTMECVSWKPTKAGAKKFGTTE